MKNNSKNLQKNRIHIPLLPFLVIFFLSPLLIIVPFYILTEVNFFLGSFLFLLIICLPTPLYILNSMINKKINNKDKVISVNIVLGICLFLLLLLIVFIILLAISGLLLILFFGAVPSIITAIYSHKYLSKIIVMPFLPVKTLMMWIFVTILWGAISSFIPAFILAFIYHSPGASTDPAPLFFFSLIGAICALFSCIVLIAPIKLDHRRQLRKHNKGLL